MDQLPICQNVGELTGKETTGTEDAVPNAAAPVVAVGPRVSGAVGTVENSVAVGSPVGAVVVVATDFDSWGPMYSTRTSPVVSVRSPFFY